MKLIIILKQYQKLIINSINNKNRLAETATIRVSKDGVISLKKNEQL